MTAPLAAIPTELLRGGYEAERDAWQYDLARLQARLSAQQHIAAALGTDNAAHIARIVADMEIVATGLAKINELLAALPAEGGAALVSNGKVTP